MGIFGKLKNALFTEEETVEIPVINEEKKVEEPVYSEPRVEERPVSRFNNYNFEEETKEDVVVPPHFDNDELVVEEEKEEVEEKRSPFQTFDEEEFDRLAAINKNRLLERDRKAREEKEIRENSLKHKNLVSMKSNIQTSSTSIEKVEEPKFKPTPVISPVYGILDKNYTKEDILPKASAEGTLPKVMDIDSVRKKAFGTLEDDIEAEDIKPKDIDDIKITSFEDQVDEDTSVLFTKEEIAKALEDDEEEKKEVKTRSKKVSKVEDEIPEIEEEKEIQEEVETVVEEPVDEVEEVKEEKVENNDKDKELEKDLFNLIDSMYQDEEGDK